MNTDGTHVLLYACFGVEPAPWIAALRRLAPDVELRVWPQAGDVADVDFIFTWDAPRGFFEAFPNLQAVFSLGAGVDGLLGDSALPRVPIVRMVDTGLVLGMKEFVLMRALHYHRQMPHYEAKQRAGEWAPLRTPLARDRTVGIMGLGQLGSACAQALAAVGFQVRGWSRTAKSIEGVQTFAGTEALPRFLTHCEILVCLLPLTPNTRDILNRELFDQLPRGAYLINVGRGAHLVENDLMTALDTGQLRGATLDVFRHEPLPSGHPFWRHPAITVVPHAAAFTHPETAAAVLVTNMRRAIAKAPLSDVVDLSRGY